MAEAALEGKYLPLTIDNISRVLLGVDYEKLGVSLRVTDHKRDEIKQQFSTQADRMRATVEYWLSVDPTSSWRRLVWALDQSEEHQAVDGVKPYVEPLTDPSLTAENVSRVLKTSTLDYWKKVCGILDVPHSRRGLIEREHATGSQRRQAAVDWWLRYSPTASWAWLAGRLYRQEKKPAVSQYIQKETADSTLTPTNLLTALTAVSDWWGGSGLCAYLQVPGSVKTEIQQQSSDATQQKKTLFERWLRDHPAPSWAVVAEALFWMREHGVLEQVKKIYITGSAKQLFEDAMRHGRVKSQVTKVLITGIAGSGKTCTKHVLIDEPPPPLRKSTACAETPLRLRLMKVGVRREDVKWDRRGARRMVNYLAATMKAHKARKARKLKAKLSSDDGHERVQAGQPGPSSPPSSGSRLHHEARPDVAMQENLQSSTSHEPGVASSMPPQSPGVESTLDTSVTEDELVRLIEQSVGSELLHEIEWVQFVDSGGQPQFLEVYPAFHRRTSVWVFVLKLSERLDQHPMVEYYDQDGKLVCKPYTAAHTSKEILLYSMRSLRSHGCAPKILIVGTHKDKERECEESREDKNRKLREMLLPEFENELIFHGEGLRDLIFPLNAQSPGEDEQRIAHEIRKVIMEQCSPQADMLPLGWYALELKLREIAEALGEQVISWKVCFEVAHKLHFDEQSFNAALSYLDELNIIYYYRGVLSEMVFCDTQVLLDKVTELVHMSYKLRENPNPKSVEAFGAEWRRFRDYGVVSSKLLECDAFKKHYVPGLFTPRELIKLFQSLLILADFSEEDHYFMPSLLHHLVPTELEEHRSSTSFILHFPHGTRNGIFCSLIAFLISCNNSFPHAWKLAVQSRSTIPVCLSRNCVVFSVPSFAGRVTLIDSCTFYEVHINARIEQPELYLYVRDAMITGLEKAAANLHYPNCHPVIAFPCPCSQGELHPATVSSNKMLWLCSIDDDKYDKLEEKQLMWICSSPVAKQGMQLPTLENLLDNVKTVEWFRLGLKLGVQQYDLDVIEKNRMHDMNGALLDMLRKWLRQCENPTWGAVVRAMKATGEGREAKKLEDMFC